MASRGRVRGLVFATIIGLETAGRNPEPILSGELLMRFSRTVDPHRARAGRWIVLIAAATLGAFAGSGVHAASIQPLEIVTKSGVQVFSVEMATTEEEKTTGLMYRKELAEGKGMLFDFSPEQQVSMWMKNTFISLDMIFIRADGRILRIAENTEPQSTKIISSGGPAKGVLEVIAGTAKKYGIAPGDRVAHPLFNGR
ncbi:MAG: hypothetical protein JWR80_2519 [Bradyrhizobium sp.]|nr:hypothetical protein [Bradyrhizobium sp.]